jgi:hypothetical protein
LRQLLHVVISNPQMDEGAVRVIWDVIFEGMQLFDEDVDKNPLIQAVRVVKRENPNEIVLMTQDARRFLHAASSVIPWFWDASLLTQLTTKGAHTVDRILPIGMTAVLALERNNPFTINLRNRIRAGDTSPAVDDLRRLREIGQMALRNTISLEARND